MANEIKTILAELYQLDPELKKYEPDLIRIVSEIIKVKPNTKFDKKFAAQLRSQLLSETKTSQSNSLRDLFNMKKLAYALGGAVLAALVMIPLLKNPQTGQMLNLNAPTPEVLDMSLKISRLGNEAFGSLVNQTVDQLAAAPQAMADGTEATNERSQSGGGTPAAPVPMGFGGGAGVTGVSIDAKMIAPAEGFVTYKYVYAGDELTLDESTVDVFKRVKGLNNQSSLNSLLSGFNLGLLNLGSFGQSTIDNITVTESGRYGYMINIQANEGFISINKNWLTWPQVTCTDPNCENLRIRESDIPADDVLIKLANDFIAKHNISLEGYGSPEVQTNWRLAYEQTQNKSEYWFPDTVNVIYPLEINGQQAYEQYGTDKVGLIVSIDVREKKVAGLSNLTNQNYQSSSYQSETSAEKILAFAERGGINAGWWAPEDSKVVEVTLGTPTKELIRYYRYQNNQTEELLIPALIFPVTKRPDNSEYFYAQSVVVPLVSELLNQDNGGGPIRIMPAGEPAQIKADEPAANPGIQELK
ncbi:MAG: hypothetical protein HUU49_01955 [Candidatus Buchananbacteria bacterium]|nr:hypothetical protein [Candidatus Buchananbacteria bacterium]